MKAYCDMCQRPVQPIKKTGAGFWVMVLFTAGLWLLTYPFKKKNTCPICKGRLN